MSIVFTDATPLGTFDTWRSLWPAAELRRRGFDAYVVGKGGRKATTGWAHNDTVIIHANNNDVGLASTVRELKAICRGVWVQFDDDYHQLPLIQDTADRELLNVRLAGIPTAGLRPWFANLTDDHHGALARADGLIAATEEVADAYREHTTGDVVVCHNWIPEWITHLPMRRADPPVIGWFGGLGAHRRDIEWLGAHARDLTRFGVVGEPDGVAEITGADLAIAKPWQPWARLYREIGRFSVGVVPVVDDAFNAPKSWIKPLEFAAMGVRSITGLIPAYRRAYEMGLPIGITDDPAEMVIRANGLLDLGEAGPEAIRQVVRKRFTLESVGGDEWAKWAAEAGAS